MESCRRWCSPLNYDPQTLNPTFLGFMVETLRFERMDQGVQEHWSAAGGVQFLVGSGNCLVFSVKCLLFIVQFLGSGELQEVLL